MKERPACFITLPPSANEHIYISSKWASELGYPAHNVHQTLWHPLIITYAATPRRFVNRNVACHENEKLSIAIKIDDALQNEFK